MKKIGLFSICTIILLACNTRTIIFDKNVKNELEANNLPSTKLQYYLSSRIKLVSEKVPQNTVLKDGKIETKSQKIREVIWIKSQTKGILVREDKEKNILYMKFEDGGMEKEIKFGLHINNNIQEYRLLIENQDKTINYDGNNYRVLLDGSNPSLLITTEEYRKSKSKVRSVKGINVQK